MIVSFYMLGQEFMYLNNLNGHKLHYVSHVGVNIEMLKHKCIMCGHHCDDTNCCKCGGTTFEVNVNPPQDLEGNKQNNLEGQSL